MHGVFGGHRRPETLSGCGEGALRLNETAGRGDTWGMRRSPLALLVLLQLAVIMIGAPLAFAATPAERVVVVVDGSAGLALDGDAIRRAISEELRAPVLAPSEPAAGGAASILVVSGDGTTIRLILRSNSAASATTRTIPASPDRSVRLREIGWLAGNLLRDQVSPIVASRPAAESRSAPATEPPASTPEPKPAPAAAPALGAGGSAAPLAPSVDALTARGSGLPGPPRPEWTVAALAGLIFPTAATYQLDIQRRAAPGRLAVGAALQLGSTWAGAAYGGHNVHVFGLGGFIAKERRGSRWFIDGASGLGIEAAHEFSGAPFNGPQCMPSAPCPAGNVVSPDLKPFLFVRLTSTAGVALTSGLDLVVRLTGQLSSGGILMSDAGATAGIRLRGP